MYIKMTVNQINQFYTCINVDVHEYKISTYAMQRPLAIGTISNKVGKVLGDLFQLFGFIL